MAQSKLTLAFQDGATDSNAWFSGSLLTLHREGEEIAMVSNKLYRRLKVKHAAFRL